MKCPVESQYLDFAINIKPTIMMQFFNPFSSRKGKKKEEIIKSYERFNRCRYISPKQRIQYVEVDNNILAEEWLKAGIIKETKRYPDYLYRLNLKCAYFSLEISREYLGGLDLVSAQKLIDDFEVYKYNCGIR